MNEVLVKVLDNIKEISYGWYGIDNAIHHHAKINYFKEFYRTMSLEDIKQYKVGTCIEQVYYTEYLLKQEKIDSSSFIIIYNDPTKIARHTICVVNDSDKYYLMENEWNINGLKPFNSLEELLRSVVDRYPRMYKINNFDESLIEIYNYDNYKEGLSLEEFCNNCRQCKRVII